MGPKLNPMELEFVQETETLAQILDQLDYFQVLKISQSCNFGEIREAFHRESRSYHPDRYNALPDSSFKTNVARIYKRITEAYVTLRDDVKRSKYIGDINGPERQRKLRFTEADEVEAREQQKKAQVEQIGVTVKGRQLYQQAMRDLQADKPDAALRSLKLAATFEPQNQLFKDQLAALEAALREASKKRV